MRAFVVVGLLLSTACLSDPQFQQVSEETTTTTAPTISSDEMVLVPETTVASLSLTNNGGGKPNAPGQNKKDDDDDDDDDDDEGGGPKPPKPAPAPSNPAPTPAPAPASASKTVPAFWVDGAAVAADEYAACVTAGACAAASCPAITSAASCVTRAQASAFCGWKGKRLVRDAEWSALLSHTLPEVTGLSGGYAEWVDADAEGGGGVVRGGSSPSARVPLGLDSSIPTVGFRCARDR